MRYFNVFGPRQDPSSQYSAVIPKFIAALLAGERPVIYGDGEQFRDFTYVDNVVQANLLAAKIEGVSGRVFNVGCNDTLTVNTLYRTIEDLLGVERPPRYEPSRPGDVRLSRAGISPAAAPPGVPPGAGARSNRGCGAGRRWACGTSTCSAPGKIRPASTPP